jgi:hypothetical protein
MVIDINHEALTCWVVASDAGVVGATEPVVHGFEEPLEHHWVQYAGEVPLDIPVRGCGRQLTSRAMVRLVVGGSDEVPDCQQVVAREILVRRHIGVGR